MGQRVALEHLVGRLEARISVLEEGANQEGPWEQHHALHEEMERRLGLLHDRDGRHRVELNELHKNTRNLQDRLRRVEDEQLTIQAKVSWGGGSCRIPADYPTLT